MPHKTDWKGWFVVVLAALGIAGSIISGLFRLAVAGRMELVEARESKIEARVSAIEQSQVDQNFQWLKTQGEINQQLLALNLSVSNISGILESHKLTLQRLGGGRQ